MATLSSPFKALRMFLLLALPLALAACGINSVPTAEENAKAKWADVQAAYQRRADLIPNLVAVARNSAQIERETLEGVISARASATQVQVTADQLSDPAKVQAFQAAQNNVSGALSRLLVTVERYPDLKSQERFADLMTQLEGTENRINISIRDYNLAVQDYNTRIRTFPEMIGAKLIHGAKPLTPFEAKAGADTTPDVGAMFNGN
ncbi:LemA protein [Sphingobium sp. B2D3A]|uniref:LemA family protein n=1 Tax=Sphingobium TaxID=165695 RepID=UPI0015EB5CD0|nr:MULTISPECIES: LemA family protein [Sphingobium]MCW2338761.1 LemA protein [Sphingobium sp. B2D3A]MCW2349770.1 LemA protein [Sphingobium sp. B12D2B]MCW2364423.1 LemA protein [Sphingobium sp. B10D3B]MCW2367070.1 LemA protein [Sphingobium sp. B7D2B]MCW2368887.1 LemA protein [Sphingobium sp. B11D3D]